MSQASQESKSSEPWLENERYLDLEAPYRVIQETRDLLSRATIDDAKAVLDMLKDLSLDNLPVDEKLLKKAVADLRDIVKGKFDQAAKTRLEEVDNKYLEPLAVKLGEEMEEVRNAFD